MAIEETGVKLVVENEQGFRQGLGSANEGLAQFGRNAQQATAGTGPLTAGTIALGTALGNLASQGLMMAGRELLQLGTNSVKVAGDYEAALNVFSAVTGSALTEGGKSIDDFSKLFLKLGQDTQYSAAQAAQAAIEMAKGGLDPAAISAGGLEAALGLASSAGLGLSQSASIMAAQLGIWADTGVSAANVTDLLSQAANASVAEVDELALGLANAGGAFKVAGGSFEDLTTSLALLAPGFSSAADAGTSLKTFMLRLVPTTKKQTEAMMELGLATEDGQSKFFDAQGNFIGMAQSSQLLQDSLKGLTNDQRLATLSVIFGQDALRAAAMLAEEGAAGFDEMAASMTAAGSATDQAAARNHGFNFAMEQVKGSIETVQIQLLSAFLPALSSLLVNGIMPVINSLGTWGSEAIPGLIASLSGAGSSLGQFAAAFDPIFQAVGNLVGAFGSSMPMIKTFVDDGLKFVQGLIAKFGPQIIGSISNTLNTLAEFWRNHGAEIMAIVNFAFRVIALTVATVLSAVSTIVDVAVTYITGLWEFFSLLLQGRWSDALKLMAKVGQDIFNKITTFATTFIEGVANLIGTNLETIKSEWKRVFDLLPQLISAVSGRISTEVSKIVDSVRTTIEAWISDAVSYGRDFVDGIGQGISAAAAGMVASLLGAVRSALSAARNLIGAHSPAKVPEELIGKPFGQGITVGLMSEADNVMAAASGLLGSLISIPQLVPQMAYAGASSSTASTTLNFSPNYYGAQPDAQSDFNTLSMLLR